MPGDLACVPWLGGDALAKGFGAVRRFGAAKRFGVGKRFGVATRFGPAGRFGPAAKLGTAKEFWLCGPERLFRASVPLDVHRSNLLLCL